MERILLVHNYYQHMGGEDLVFAAEAELLRSHGHDVVEYVRRSSELTGSRAFKVPFEAVWSFSTQRELSELIRASKPDIAHFHNIFPLVSPSGYAACRRHGVPVVQTLHNYRLLCSNGTLFRGSPCEECRPTRFAWPAVFHACYRGSRLQSFAAATSAAVHRLRRVWERDVDVYVALTDYASCKLSSTCVPAERVVVKPNWVEDPGVGRGERTYALIASRLSPEKGIRETVDAWQRLASIPLKIAGDGPMKVELERIVHNRSSVRVELLGMLERQQVLTLLKGAFCLVFPSQCYEMFPMAIVEAFACGTPVVATRMGAMAELVSDGRTGLLFEPGDSSDLAAKVSWLSDHAEEARRMGENARREYETKYTPASNYEALRSIYEQAVERGKEG